MPSPTANGCRKSNSTRTACLRKQNGEYACRAGSAGKWSFPNDDLNLLSTHSVFGYRDGAGPHLVGHKLPNAFGLFDMHGNVYEWCHDWYSEDYYQQSPPVDPVGPTQGNIGS